MLEAMRRFHESQGRLPYPLIVWRLIWAVPAYVLLTAAAMMFAIGWGPRAAAEFWDRERPR